LVNSELAVAFAPDADGERCRIPHIASGLNLRKA